MGIFLFRNRSAIIGASRLPRLFNGLSKSIIDESFQLDLACLKRIIFFILILFRNHGCDNCHRHFIDFDIISYRLTMQLTIDLSLLFIKQVNNKSYVIIHILFRKSNVG